ncbi:MAG TPA: Na+/H+ antiporter subunit E [Alicycliphilus sp.]|jgi:multicomponent K+:H+ antiporter subunit E|uniref:Na+/H+ antiporter subunit E n=1 Tax=Diaphorobacter limosus TaxID=3036128 RepID=A0ABZ0J6L4_9BURK|nr:Na+/H+ antiporter subunit E [Diaphorobacter sp. Y-1]MBP6752044.1 Na+/H+ antiporter subunit E [Alicycliphilus sp.]MCA0441462.1 Na+/H+ antiporter subunit E [Pseudomonadota bacterium]MBP7325819.1 Na+/H+ antiporter subunit E [Alicycliphilus sp.]MBP7328188.1 Na+/H+ antiporter subunit E [Alicycliphilus sp.]MBP8137745.1 Na+/H+ antiporter subunit E [Alicycliphilus sp.]
MMKKILPAPLVSFGLFVVWLLLNRSLSPGHLLLALLLALGLPVLFKELRPQKVRVRHLGTVLRLCWTVVVDTTQSNIAVLRFLLLPRTRRHSADFVKIPLELRDPNGLAVLAMIVCITPGTVWAELSRDRSMLMLHVLEVHDREAIVQHVQTRYERPLMEIFE